MTQNWLFWGPPSQFLWFFHTSNRQLSSPEAVPLYITVIGIFEKPSRLYESICAQNSHFLSKNGHNFNFQANFENPKTSTWSSGSPPGIRSIKSKTNLLIRKLTLDSKGLPPFTSHKNGHKSAILDFTISVIPEILSLPPIGSFPKFSGPTEGHEG